MIRRLAALAIPIAALIGIAWYANREGTLTLRIGDTLVEMGAGTAAILLVAVFALLQVGIRVVRFVRSPRKRATASESSSRGPSQP
jgi:uncharacterized membrane-anchored protein